MKTLPQLIKSARQAIKKKNWSKKITPKVFKYMREAGMIIILLTGIARAEAINIEKLATAIYYAEGGAKTSHPYGILAHYKYTTPREACINTIKHALKDWNGKGDFISFLGSRYAPLGAKNDPTGLNRNWVSNVRRLYYKYLALSTKRE